MEKNSFYCTKCGYLIVIEGNISLEYHVMCSYCKAINKNPYFSSANTCNYCGSIIDYKTHICTLCGRDYNKNHTNNSTGNKSPLRLGRKQLVGLIALILLSFLLAGYIVNESNKSDYEYLIGQPVLYDQYDDLGYPETIMGTNNKRWVVYFEKANFTMVSNKETDIIMDIKKGRKPFRNSYSPD